MVILPNYQGTLVKTYKYLIHGNCNFHKISSSCEGSLGATYKYQIYSHFFKINKLPGYPGTSCLQPFTQNCLIDVYYPKINCGYQGTPGTPY